MVTQHSTSSHIGFVFDEVKTYQVKYVEELQAESDRRLEMLILLKSRMKYRCLSCYGILNWIGDEEPTSIGHADGCELAAECHG